MQAKTGVSKKIIGAILAGVFLLSVAGNVFLFMQYRALSADPQQQARQETATLVAAVSQLMILPEGEDPTIATVADTEKLKDQPFFANAEVGDKVLLFTTSKRAILYRPSANKIIEVAPINLGQAAAAEDTVVPTPAADDTTVTP